MKITAAVALVMVCMLGLGTSAFADVKASDKSTPWSQGVSKKQQQAALALFTKGNALFEVDKYADALVLYEQALKEWDHPNIRFNAAVCLIKIRQPLQAWESLEKALAYGEGPLGKRLFKEAQGYQSLLEATLTQVTISSEQPEVRIMLDGEELLVGVGAKTRRLLAGRHQLVATRAGYVTETRVLELPPGEQTTERVELKKEVVKVKINNVNYTRRWKWWVPWAFVGGSVAVALGGTGVYLSARSDIQEYDRKYAAACPLGCTETQTPLALRNDDELARRKSGYAVAMWVGAGAVGAVAAVLAVMNRPRVEEQRPKVTAVIEPGYVGAGVTLTWW